MYLNPAFGGLLLQALVAIAAVAGGVVFSLRKKIRSFFKKDGDEDVASGDITETDSDEIDMIPNEEK